MIETSNILFPGSPWGILKGCTCPQGENHYGKGLIGRQDEKRGPFFIINADCPLHGPSRFIGILAMATKVLEGKEAAIKWLNRPQSGLGGRIPIHQLHTEAGAKEVENLLGIQRNQVAALSRF